MKVPFLPVRRAAIGLARGYPLHLGGGTMYDYLHMPFTFFSVPAMYLR